MGLISRDSSRTYRNYKWHRKLSASTLCSKSETRSSPETRSIGLRESPTHHGDDQRVSIVPSDDDTVDKLATQVSVTVPTKIPDTPAETRWVSRSFSFTTWTNLTADDVQPSLGLRNRLRCQLQKANRHHRTSRRFERSRHQLQSQASIRRKRINVNLLNCILALLVS